MAQFFEAEDRASQIRALVKADTILSKIDDLLDNMSPMKYEEFLSPLCSKRDLLFTESDQDLLKLLTALCDFDSLMMSEEWPDGIKINWYMLKMRNHYIRNILKDIGGLLFSLRNEISAQNEIDALHVSTETNNRIHLLIAILPFGDDAFQLNLLGLQLRLVQLYFKSVFHAKAVSLVREIVQKVILACPDDGLIVSGDLLTQQLLVGVGTLDPDEVKLVREEILRSGDVDSKFVVSKDALLQMFEQAEALLLSETDEPQVMPWIILLKWAVPSETERESTLLNDTFIIQLKTRIETL